MQAARCQLVQEVSPLLAEQAARQRRLGESNHDHEQVSIDEAPPLEQIRKIALLKLADGAIRAALHSGLGPVWGV